MAVDEPVSDTSRAIQHDPDQTWPTSVVLQVAWFVDGHTRMRTSLISSDMFFGRGQYGAPLPGDSVINMIEQMRRAGPPPLLPKTGPKPNDKRLRPKGKRHAQGRDVADRKGAALRVKRKGPS